MTTHTLPIVGAHFRPPAKQLLAAIAGGTDLALIPEPENPYDPNAVRVVLCGESITVDDETLMDQLAGTGYDIDDIRSGVFHVGYIPKTEAVWVQPRMAGAPAAGVFAFTMEGKPAVTFELGE